VPSSEVSAAELVAGFVGQTVHTISQRRPNRIIGLEADEVIVQTGAGRDRVPIAQVDMALELLRREGEIRVTPEAFPEPAFRSSFVGALLAELDDVEVLTDPQRVRIRQKANFARLLQRACVEVTAPRTTARYSGADPFAILLVRELRDGIDALVPPDGSWKVKGSAGQGNWAETPWVAVFDLNVTDTAQRGFYVVFLIRRDGTGVWLSLNQGTTDVHKQAGARHYESVLRHRAASYAELLTDAGVSDFYQGPMPLGGGRPPLTPGYEAGNIAGRWYPTGAIPDDTLLVHDLNRMLGLYRALIEAQDAIAPAFATDVASEPQSLEERRQLRWHLRAEGRSRRALKEAKRLQGYRCCVCGVDFAAEFGDLGRRCIDAHHLTPFRELGDRPRRLDPTGDFAIVCVNHHRMLHATTPPLTPEQLRKRLGLVAGSGPRSLPEPT